MPMICEENCKDPGILTLSLALCSYYTIFRNKFVKSEVKNKRKALKLALYIPSSQGKRQSANILNKYADLP